MKPQELAEQILKTLGDADSNTAYTALDIAKLLLSHRETAARAFTFDEDSPQCI